MRLRPVARRPLLACAAAGLLAATLTAAPAAASPATGAAGDVNLSGQVEALRADVARAADRLSAGTVEYESAADRLAVLTSEQNAAQAALRRLRHDSTETRSRLESLARAAYKGGMPAELTALLAGDPRALADLARIRESISRVGGTQHSALAALDAQRANSEHLVAERDRLRRQALADKQALDARLDELRAEAAALGEELARSAERLRAAEQAERVRRLGAGLGAAPRSPGTTGGLPAGGEGCSAPDPTGDVNGFLAAEDLCPLEVGNGHRLRTDAAVAFNALNRQRIADTGSPLCVTDSYRSYPEQVDVFQRKPSLAAVPGTSQHGWGLAVDLGCGAQQFGTEMDRWLRANAGRFGWTHPAWAEPGGRRPEPWHWEYVGA